jgi:tRNA(Ile)-lysidine synthase
MLQKFKQFIIKEKLLAKDQRILLAVSGGIDSVTLCHLMHEAGFKFGIAHCNFKLRGKESEEDEKFVRQLSLKFKVPFFHHSFETKKYSEEKKISVQMAARELRYDWFEEIRRKNNYHFIAVAHHQDDEIETFFINLIRGTGIAGLHGIKAKAGKIIRPLMFASRKEIEEYIRRKKIKYREDSSNSSLKYLRNQVRHQLIPQLKKMNPDMEETIKSEISRIRKIESVFYRSVEEKRKEIIKKEEGILKFDIKKLLSLGNRESYLYEFLKPFGFSGDIIEMISQGMQSEPGKIFYSSTHRLLKDRSFLVLSPVPEKTKEQFFVKEGCREMKVPVPLKFKTVAVTARFNISKDKNIGMFDRDKLTFPLTIRKWKAGDLFRPFGMKGKKKLSDFCTDIKLSLLEKENTWLLCSGGDIIWVIGHRTDDRYRITAGTKRVFSAEKFLTKA